MRNRRIGKINGKVVMLDTPPLNDIRQRKNEIALQMRTAASEIPLYFCYIKDVIDNGVKLITGSGRVIDNISEIYSGVIKTFGSSVFGNIDAIIANSADGDIQVRTKYNSNVCYPIDKGDIIASASSELAGEEEYMMGDAKLKQRLIDFKSKLGLIKLE